MTVTDFLFPRSPSNSVVSADTSLQPLSLRYNFKFGKGTTTNLGPSGLPDTMSFAPRNLAPGG